MQREKKKLSNKQRDKLLFAPTLPSHGGAPEISLWGQSLSLPAGGGGCPCQPPAPPDTLVPCQLKCSTPALPAPVTASDSPPPRPPQGCSSGSHVMTTDFWWLLILTNGNLD